MNSGTFRHYIIVLEKLPTNKKNILDENILEFQEVKSFWGSYENKTGSMLYGKSADSKLAKTTHKITYRYMNYPELNVSQIIKIGDSLFDIEYIDDLNNRHEIMEVFLSRRNKSLISQRR